MANPNGIHIVKYSMEYAILFLCANTIGVIIFSYATNPFNRKNLIKDPHRINIDPDGSIKLEYKHKLRVRSPRFFSVLATLKSGYHIVSNTLSKAIKTNGNTINTIIDEIHSVRFNPQNPFIISGDHFSVLYPRSLGIFYHTLLDGRTAIDQTDWTNRQSIYMKTLAYALQTYSKSKNLSTTIVPVGPLAVTLVNIYAYPSDTLFSLLYALKTLTDDTEIKNLYPFTSKNNYNLQTRASGLELLNSYRSDLRRHYSEYQKKIIDTDTGLIKKSLLLSSTKDMAKRQSAFYDNVVYWRTTQLAQDLGIIDADKTYLDELKQKIIKTYWNDRLGIFNEDLSSTDDTAYSSDWLIACQTGFLSPANISDRTYLTRSADYISNNNINKPFGLKYHSDSRKKQLHWPVRLFAPKYGSTVIWSHWGMEYIKLLIRLAVDTGKDKYFQIASSQLDSYERAIINHRAYPEVYGENGLPYKQGFYRSVMRTGWIVNYEQAKTMYQSKFKS